MLSRKGLWALFGAVLSTGLTFGPAVAADYPSKPIQMIVAYGAGGSTDTVARVFAKYAEERLGERLVVVNKPGAGGELGWVHLANAEPDGYTIGFINSPAVEVHPIARPETVGYDYEDIRPLANLITDPGILAVAADSPYQNLDDFVAAAKEQPDSITVSHEGVGGGDHLAALNFSDAAGIDLNFVSFNGNAEAMAALRGGHIDAFEGNMSEAAAQIQDGSIRALAVWSESRMSDIPDVPTGVEQGYEVIEAASRGIAVPADLPQDIYDRLLKVVKSVVEDEDFRAEVEKLNMPLDPMYAEEYEAYLDRSHDRLKALWEKDPWIEQ